MMEQETLIAYGDTVKALGDGKIGGYLVRFSGPKDPDLEGEFFTKDTAFGPAKQSVVYYQHGMDDRLKRRELDDDAELRADDIGVWCEAQLMLRDEYEQFLYEMAEAGKLGWSSGTASHLVEYEAMGPARWIKRWPLGLDASLTPTPAEPRNTAIPLKGWTPAVLDLEAEPGGGDDPPPAPAEVAVTGMTGSISVKAKGVEIMDTDKTAPEGKATPVAEVPHAFEAQMKALSDRMDEIMRLMQDSPAIRKAGIYTVDGGTADKSVKNFGDFLMAVKRGDMERLAKVYVTKTMPEDEGAAGGILVPEEYRTDLLRVAEIASPIVGLVQRIPVNSDAGEWPALDVFTAPTANVGDTATAAGVTAAIRTETGDYAETEPKFTWLQWRVHEVGGIVPVSKNLAADSPLAISTLLTQLFGIAIAHKLEHYILRGTGVGQPLGVLNAPCAINVDPDVNGYFGYADALEMVSRFMPITEKVRWAMHQTLIPDLGTWELGTAGAAAPKIADLGFGQPVKSQHLPAADSSGCIVLGDWGSYLLFERSGLTVAYSEHAYFASGRVAWRFDQRCDGMPWLKDKVTLADASTTVSPFVFFND